MYGSVPMELSCLCTMPSSSDLTIGEYNEEVCYCKHCHSLCIITDEDLANDDWDGSYCGKCNSTDIGVCKFGDWLRVQEEIDDRKRKAEWNK